MVRQYHISKCQKSVFNANQGPEFKIYPQLCHTILTARHYIDVKFAYII